MITQAFVCTHRGSRHNNEDNFYFNGKIMLPEQAKKAPRFKREGEFDSPVQVFAVCDGMGGGDSGEEASLAAVESMGEVAKYVQMGISPEDSLKRWSVSANEKVLRCAPNKKAGTTVVAAVITEKEVRFAHLGDSRAYLMSGRKLIQATEDHKEASRLKKMNPNISFGRNAVTCYLGMDMEQLIVTPTISGSMRLKAQQSILLCSDGVSNALSEKEIRNVLYNYPGDPAAQLIRKAVRSAKADNCTAIVIDIVKA